jgi:hypothetical protein
MATTTPHQQPTPDRFFNAINAYEQTEAMKAAAELEIFTAIAEGNTTAATIAKRCEGAERGVRTLCDFLTIHGFLTKERGQYALAPDSALFLDRHSPAYIGAAIEFLLAGLMMLLVRPTRLLRSAVVLKPSTLLALYKAMSKGKYRMLFSLDRRRRPGPKGPSAELIRAVVEMKQRNPHWGCLRIASTDVLGVPHPNRQRRGLLQEISSPSLSHLPAILYEL